MSQPVDRTRRRAPRVRVDVKGRLLGRTEKPVTVLDLSIKGCLVRCPLRLNTGSIHDLSLALADGPLEAKARVTEVSLDGASLEGQSEARYLVGLEFLGLPPAAASRLRGVVAGAARPRER